MDQNASVVYLLDDDPRVLEALSALLEAHGLRTRPFSSVEKFLAGHDPRRPGCLILDVCLPGTSGIALQAMLRQQGVVRPIVFITGQGDIPTTVQAMRGGAVTFLPKPVARAELLSAVREAIGRDAIEREQRRGRADLEARLSKLTPRERQVMDLVVSGMLNKQIAAELGTAVKTIKVHRSKVMHKLQVRTPAGLAALVSPAGEQRAAM